jgi:FkbM family methyltransferase
MDVKQIISRHWRRARKASQLVQRPVWRRGLMSGIGATIEHEPALADLQVRTVVDVGANIGQFSLLALELFPGCRIIAFEPLPGPAARFRSFFKSYPNVRLVEAAIGREAGQVPMYVSQRDDSSSLLPISGLQTSIFPGTGLAETRSVELAPLRHFVSREEIEGPALLKIDVQGAELAVLEGAADLLDAFDHVYVECSRLQLYEGQPVETEIIGFLERAGFDLVGRFNQTSHPVYGVVQEDCLLRRGLTPTPALGSA